MRTPAWEGDWEKRIYERVFQRDFPSLTAFAESRPTATLKQLAADLASEKDIAAVQLERLLRYEAHTTGHIHRFARASLVREICEHFPEGWMRGGAADFSRASVYSKWRGRVGEDYDTLTDRVWDSLKKIAPVGWLPSHPDDPVVVQAFREGAFPEDGDPGERGTLGGPA